MLLTLSLTSHKCFVIIMHFFVVIPTVPTMPAVSWSSEYECSDLPRWSATFLSSVRQANVAEEAELPQQLIVLITDSAILSNHHKIFIGTSAILSGWWCSSLTYQSSPAISRALQQIFGLIMLITHSSILISNQQSFSDTSATPRQLIMLIFHSSIFSSNQQSFSGTSATL
jgi:hypothetical protein